jgi:8-oxo-dGTP pyrophosphatase MutT (NUDIX family)
MGGPVLSVVVAVRDGEDTIDAFVAARDSLTQRAARHTNKGIMRTLAVLTVFYLACLVGCTRPYAPDCPYTGAVDEAPSAGCFSLVDNKLLVVQGMDGSIGPPGGSAEPGESAQCAAFRETWEETGLRLQPVEKIATFDTGFFLYDCARDEHSGEIDPPPRLEVRQAFYLPVENFPDWNWRFPGQQQLILTLINTRTRGPGTPAPPPE